MNEGGTMNNNEDRIKALRRREIPLQVISNLSLIALGLSAQAVLTPPAVVPFLQDPAVAKWALAGSAVISVITGILHFRTMKERGALSRQHADN
jgi:hypothetical protein